jgi:hypothetical protein
VKVNTCEKFKAIVNDNIKGEEDGDRIPKLIEIRRVN